MDIQSLIDEYATWLKSEITTEKVGEYVEITSPYLDSENDYVQIYVKQDGDTIYFTDDAYTIQKLKMSGFTFTPVREQHLNHILNQFGIQRSGDELTTKATARNFPQKKHMFIQAILRINDMFALTRAKVSSMFLDDVKNFLDSKKIFYSDDVQFMGKSGFTHSYDFLIQRSQAMPERLCRTVNKADKTAAGNIIFEWTDTKITRRTDSQLIVIINDSNPITQGVEEALSHYDSKLIHWSERNSEKNIELLSA